MFKNKKISKYMNFIEDSFFSDCLKKGTSDIFQVRDVIDKSLDLEPLTLEETTVLLRAGEPEMHEMIFQAAKMLKKRVYGNRIVLFAPLYIGNECINDCTYCAFRRSNKHVKRISLSREELREQVIALEDQGHKRLILVWGEHPSYNAHHIAESVRTVYATKHKHGEIRRVNINAAPLEIEDYKIVKEAGIGTYQVFQETYHRKTYAEVHPKNTRKGNFNYRLFGLHRAMEAGIDDVGIGALFGLYDWRYEILGLVAHAQSLRDNFGVGCHTISFPRLKPASGIHNTYPHLVNDHDLKRIIAILRLAVPYTGLILTAREPAELRQEAMAMGVSQIDAGSRIEIGGYTQKSKMQDMEKEQFMLADLRSLDLTMREIMADGYVPSFCTACYRLGRTGEHFMEFAIPGFINKFCTPNALLTLTEYLVDYASSETRAVGSKLIEKELQGMNDNPHKNELLVRLEQIKNTEQRDLYF